VSQAATMLWRYLSFPKFVSMLETGTLFFCPLRQFDDEYEGFIDDSFYETALLHMMPIVGGEERVRWTIDIATLHIMDACFVSCWHIAARESATMWKQYGGDGDGVVLKTRADKLTLDFGQTEVVKAIAGAVCYDSGVGEISKGVPQVVYGDKAPDPTVELSSWYRQAIVRGNNPYEPPKLIEYLSTYRFMFTKRPCFEAENEYRIAAISRHNVDFVHWKRLISTIGLEYGTCGALHNFYTDAESDVKAARCRAWPMGQVVPFDLSLSIDEVRVHPKAKPWLISLVQKVLARYGIAGVRVSESELASRHHLSA
jgi:hypothetical protein